MIMVLDNLYEMQDGIIHLIHGKLVSDIDIYIK